MKNRLTPYGSGSNSPNFNAVGKGKAVTRLIARLPSADVVAKVGAQKGAAPARLAERMPSKEIAAKVGISSDSVRGFRVVRLNGAVN